MLRVASRDLAIAIRPAKVDRIDAAWPYDSVPAKLCAVVYPTAVLEDRVRPDNTLVTNKHPSLDDSSLLDRGGLADDDMLRDVDKRLDVGAVADD